MAYDYRDKCGSCVKLDIDNCRSLTYYCRKKKKYYSACDSIICRYYKYDVNRDYDKLEWWKKEPWNENQISNCYITTIMCEILSLPDDNKYLNTLREFRNNILQKDSKYSTILLEYDTIGPIIANHLKNDKDALRIAKGLIKNYLAPMIVNIENKEYEEAISIYKSILVFLFNL